MSAPNLENGSVLHEEGASQENCWVTADRPTLRGHLKHTALRLGPKWKFNVVTDAELITAWLATAGLAGVKMLDPDIMLEAAPVSLRKLTLIDMVEPPDTLIVILGVKAARNVAMPEVLMETISLRKAAGKPLWLVDQPQKPFREGHRAWSHEVREALSEFQVIRLESLAKGQMTSLDTLLAPETNTSTARRRSRSLSGGSGGTRTLKNGGDE